MFDQILDVVVPLAKAVGGLGSLSGDASTIALVLLAVLVIWAASLYVVTVRR